MDLVVFRSLWGMTGSIEAMVQAVADSGYDGIEAWFEVVPPPDQFLPLLQARGLKLIMAGHASTIADLEPTLTRLAAYKPLKIGLHSGRDSMSQDEGCRFYEHALKLEADLGIPVLHETHRGRALFTPWTTAFYLKAFPNLRIVADLSHWVNVCERLPDDQQEALELVHQRTGHIHGRVGYEEGPQVPDPRAPEYAYAVEWHEAQWRKIWQQHLSDDKTELTFTPEYGPPAYMHTLPHTNMPVANLDELCLWGAARARSILV